MAASPDGHTVAVGGKDGAIHIWELLSLRQKSVLRGFVDQIRALAYSKDGSLLVGSSYDGRVRVWNLKPGKEPDPLPIECGKVIAFAISPTSPMLATSHSEEHSNQLRLWDLRTGQEKLRVPGCVFRNNTLAFSPDGGLIACGDKDSTIRLRHSGTGEVITTLDNEMGWVKTIDFSPDGRRLAFGGRDGCVRFRDLPDEAARRIPAWP